MSRKCIPRSLPPLGEVFDGFVGFSESDIKQHLLLQELRKAANELRTPESQPFYSMREIAEFFAVPLRTVAIVYENLEREGLINRIRSSQTVLLGNVEFTQKLVRGVVGIPIWLHSLVISPHARIFFIDLEERLRKSGFIADFIFFRTREDYQPDFTERLLRHNLNYLIWHTPHLLASHVLLSMQDHGIRQITIQQMEAQVSQAKPNYLLNWEPAYQKLARTWKESGIKNVLIRKPEYLPSQRALAGFGKILNAHGMEITLTEAITSTLLEELKNKRNTAFAFLDQEQADIMCSEDPVAIEQIMKIARVAFCRGPIRLPYFHKRPSQVDIVSVSASVMADRIVSDLCQQSGRQVDTPYIFEAIYQSGVALNSNWEKL